MCCVVKCIQRRNQACVKNADLRHPSCTVVMQRRKSASPVLNVLNRFKCIGPTKEEVIECWNQINDVDLHDFALPYIKEDEMGGACGMNGREQECLQDLGVEI